MMDDPRHQRVRLLVSKGLTPRTIERLEADLRRRTARLVDAALDRGDVRLRDRRGGRAADAGDLHPAGHPRSRSAPAVRVDRAQLRLQGRPRGVRDDRRRSRRPPRRCSSTASALIAEKRAQPADDMLSVVCNATAARRGPAAAHRSGAAVLLQPVVGRGRRHDAQRDRGRDRRAHGISRAARRAPRRSATRCRPRSRRSCAGRIPPRTTAAPRRATVELGGHEIARGRQGRVLGSVGEPRRARVRRAVPLRRAPPSEPAPRLRPRHPPLPRREPRPARDPGRARPSCSRASTTIELAGPGRVDAQQQAHRDPPPARAAHAALTQGAGFASGRARPGTPAGRAPGTRARDRRARGRSRANSTMRS